MALRTLMMITMLSVLTLPTWSQPTDTLRRKPSVSTIAVKRYVPSMALGLATALTWRDKGLFSRGSVYRWRQEYHQDFHSRLDKPLQFVPIGVVFFSEALQGGTPNRFKQSALHLVKAEVLMASMVYPLKQLSHVERPSGSNFESFPSGHTAQAFLSATFLHRELSSPQFSGLKGRNWLIAGGYAAAATTATLRIMNNAHWITDVLAGAAIGMLAGNLAYDIRLGKKEEQAVVSVMPFWNRGGGLMLSAGWR